MKKLVFKLDLDDDKAKHKAMKTVAVLSGIDSISMDMKDQKLTVIGDVDPVMIVAKLRKLCHTEIVSIGPAKDPEKKKDEQKTSIVGGNMNSSFATPSILIEEDVYNYNFKGKELGNVNWEEIREASHKQQLNEEEIREASHKQLLNVEEIREARRHKSGVLFICCSITDKLSSLLVKEELELVDFVRDELVNLETVVSKVQKVLEDHSSGAWICDDETNSVPNWLKLLEDAAYDADDLLDVLVTEASMLELLEEEVENHFSWERICDDETISVQNWLKLLEDAAYDADDLLDALETEASMFELEEVEKKKQLRIRSKFSSVNTIKDKMNKIADVIYITGENLRRLFSHLKLKQEKKTKRVMAESYVFGRNDDIEAISNRLLFESDNDDAGSVQVVAICGMGGIGKTTLAHLVYASERVKNHFDIRVWVDVKQELKVGFVIRDIVKSMGTGGAFDSSSQMTWNQNLPGMKQLLRGKKFLIVLDDVWSLNQSKCDALLSALQVRGSRSNKILVTTRNQSVASIMGGTNPPYNLKLLSDEDCWLSFKQIAFPECLPPSGAISLVRREIVQRCGGLPLAAKALGSLLHSNAGENEWYDVMRSEVWDRLGRDMNSLVLPVLRLSYDLLPGHLKLCFVYCSLFPAGFHFDKNELVLLWMAEGFVHPNGGHQRMEDISGSYFEELLSRSLFEVSRVDHSNDRPRYKMHGLIHELARSIANSQGFFPMEENNLLRIPEEARHSSLLCKQCGTSTFESFYSSKGLRTLLLLGAHITHIDRLPRDLFLQLKRLRVLDLSHTSLMDVPNSIGNLLHLRYLNLSHTHVKVLPDSMSGLYNLQTLRLSNCSELVAMPRGMGKLINLRHLQLDSVSRLFSMPLNIGRLTSLQTLTVFVVGRESGHRIGELKELIELRGELQILKLENVVSLEEAEDAMLQGKEYLHKLELRWTEFKDDGVEAVLRGLHPPSSLRELQIVSYGGSQFPSWMADPKFVHLVSISLYNCIKCQLLPPLGQLPCLKYLRIDGMDRVKNIDHDFCGGGQVNGFPELEILVFEDMTNLEEWQGVVEGDIPMLRKLTITGCSKLRKLPELIIFKDLLDLDISLCPELPSLPEKGMPAMLRSLTITNCPKLKEHLQNAGGDCHKIEHIPTIWIDCLNIVGF